MATSSETASLVIKVDASQTDAGAKSLDNLSASADNADKSVQQLNETTDQQSARLKAMVAASMEKVRAQQAEIQASIGSNKATDAQRAALDALNKASNTQADMNARGAAILAAEERSRKAATVGIADQTAGLTQLLGKIDPSVAALERLDAMQAKLAAFRKSGAISGEDFAVYSAKIAQARGEIGKAAEATSHLTLNSSMARRELGRMGTDLAQGNYGRLSQTTMTLANYTGVMGLAFSAAGAAILGVVAVVGTFLVAAAKGYAESERLRTSLIATGGAAGVSAASMNELASAVGESTGKYGDARKAIELLAASGKSFGASMGAVAEQAVNMSKVTGDSVDKSVAKILEIGDSPSDAIAKLNDQYHFLTASQYAQIAALEAEGRVRDAARIANQADAQAMADRAKDIENNAGWIVKSAHWVRDEWNGAWDAIKGAGRPTSLGDQVAAVQAQIKALSAPRLDRAGNLVQANNTAEVASLNKQLHDLRGQQVAAALKTAQEQDDALKNANAIAAQRAGAAFDAPDIKRNNEIAKANKTMVDALAGAVTEEQREQYRARYANQVTAANEAYEAAINKGVPKQRKGSKADPFASLNGLVQNAQVKANNFGTENNQTQQVTSILAIVDAGAKLIASGHDVAAVQAKVAAGVAAVNDLYAKQAEQLKQKNIAALNDYIGVQEAKLKTSQQALDLQVASIGMGDREIAMQRQVIAIQKEADSDLQRLNKDRANLTADEYQQRLAVIKDYENKRVAAAHDADDRIRAAQSSWENGFQRALQNYADQASDVAGQSASLFTNAFNSMGDALASFATSGKLNFRGLVTSILGDLAKMEMRIAMSKILQSVLGAFMNNPSVYNSATPQQQVAFDVANGSANGNVFSSPGLSAYSNTIVDKPTFFAKGGNVMGEAGPEAIMPLQRGSDGKLGVKAIGADGGGINVTTIVNVDSNGNSQSQTDGDNSEAARQLGKMIETKVREVMTSESRQGGQLWRMSHA